MTEELIKKTVDYPAGSTIVKEGDEDNKLYILLEGECKVYKHGVEISSFRNKGTFFGEMSLILNTTRTATVKAATDAKVHILEIDLDEMLNNYPEMTKKILQTLAMRLEKETETIFTHIATLDITELGLDG